MFEAGSANVNVLGIEKSTIGQLMSNSVLKAG